VALLKPLKYAYFIEKSTRSVGKVSILALGMTVLHKFGPQTDLGCPWLLYMLKNISVFDFLRFAVLHEKLKIDHFVKSTTA
jgi:hypothetical protein